MIIRKLFKFEGAHIVRDCSSELCRSSVHGHSYIVEVFLTANKLDNGNMIVDFGLLKGTVKDLIESFDHAWSYWDKEHDDYKQFVQTHSDRYIEMPMSPSAEGYSLMFFDIINQIIKNTEFVNGEGSVELKSVRVHETATGYAESFWEDRHMFPYDLEDIKFSPAITRDWKNPNMMSDIRYGRKFTNPTVELKYQ